MDELVIDTNVWKHAESFSYAKQEKAYWFVKAFSESSVKLALDEGHDKSRILREYFDVITQNSVSYYLLQEILLDSDSRVVWVSVRVRPQDNGWLGRSIKNPADARFVKATINTSSKVMVSNDFIDFPRKFRRSLSKRVYVEVVSSDDFDLSWLSDE